MKGGEEMKVTKYTTRRKVLIGWMYPCDFVNFYYRKRFVLPGFKTYFRGDECACFFDKHEPIKVKVTLEKVN